MGDVTIDLVTIINILKNVRGSFNAGRLSAIVGPSGAGKSTLLNILSGLKKPSNESILLINGEKVNQSFIRKNSAYIAQDITFLGKLTTRETLEYAAKFKLPTNTSKIARLTIVEDIVQLLGMEKCLHNHVEKLSGGERKRLAIGEELITNPPVMIFDEPTSGLDSVSTVQVVRHLKDLARSGRTVICVIHQPSSFVLELFDDIYVLSDGQCLYNGSVEDIVPRFQEAGFLCPQYYNRADFILEVASQQRQGNRELLLVKARDGVKTQQSIANSLSSLNISRNGMTPDGNPSESKIFHREFLNNRYTFFPYFYAKILADLPILLICSFATLIPAYYMSGQPTESYKPLSYLSFVRYYFEGLLQTIYGFDREDLDCEGISCFFRSPKKILENLAIDETNYVWDFVGSFIWIVALKLITIFALRRQVNL
ncbi:ATP-binding cassette sub-family G member 1-like [Lutzomyia longipalpis]|uniref:ATP-binding cassette sub-family G member 1-like n=1 Tax=Lutzomyia longipalpis TaxID=7200 RepID=UPI0024843042|nr:ATP-binding cassette sub-family G member 1-like [Lutzomyia longipalpis]